jgi:hypothetical protein
MNQIIRKKCNGREKHDNDFTRDELLRKMPVTRRASAIPSASVDLPNKLVFKRRNCTEGRSRLTATFRARIYPLAREARRR